MAEVAQAGVRNLLLSKLSSDGFAALQPFLRRASHEVGHEIARNGAVLDQVWFPEGGVSAVLIPMCDGRSLAVGMVGFEGMIGASALHGAHHWRHDVIRRAASTTALGLPVERLLDVCRQHEGVRDLLLRFAGYFTMQISRATVTNLVEPLERRMARWILLYHDRLPGDDVPMTHLEIGIMLGVRRASATDVLHILEGLGAIRSTRGHIVVRNRDELEKIAGETYGDAEADYRRLIGSFGKTALPASSKSPRTEPTRTEPPA